MSDRTAIIDTLVLEREAAHLKGDEPKGAIDAIARIQRESATLASEILDNIVAGHQVHSEDRVGAAAMRLMAKTLALIETLNVDPADLVVVSCWHCVHGLESTRDGCVYCDVKRIHKPDPTPCSDDYVRRRSME